MNPNDFIPQLPGESPDAYYARVAAQRRAQASNFYSPGPTPSVGAPAMNIQGAPPGPNPALSQDIMQPPPMGPMAQPAQMMPQVDVNASPMQGMPPNPSLGQDIMQPPDPMAVAKVGPPTTDAEKSGRLQSWISMFDGVKNDPQAMMMLLKFGTEMMQPIQPGQTGLGQTGRAMQGSVDYLGQLQKSDADRMKSRADLTQTGANTDQTVAETGAIPGQIEQRAAETARTKATTPTDEERSQNLEKGKQELTKIGLEIEDLKMKAKQFPADKDLVKRLGEAEIRYKDALAHWSRTTRGQGTRGPAAAVQNREDVRKSVMKINPQKAGESQADYDKRIEPKVLEATTSSKKEREKARELYINNGTVFRNQPAAEAAAEFDMTWPPLADEPVAKPGASGTTLKFDRQGNPVK